MKTTGWGTRWEWERSKEVAVFAADDEVEQKKLSVAEQLVRVLKEFSIPLDVTDGNLKHSEDVELIQTLLGSSVKENEVDYDTLERELSKARQQGRLAYGLVVLVNKDKHEFYQPPGQEEKAIYGVGVPDGLVILRHTHRQAVRHEFGHMLGLGIHHGGCVMDYRCVSHVFCSQCRERVEEMWQEEIDEGRHKW